MRRIAMKLPHLAIIILGAAVWLTACGQEDAQFPETTGVGGGACGPWYPGGEVDAGSSEEAGQIYGIEQDLIFPCLVWESVRLDHADTYLNISDQYLKGVHEKDGPRAMVIVVSAEQCSGCVLLQLAMSKRIDDFNSAGALMIAMARRNLLGLPDADDFDLEKADEVLTNEGWPVQDWYITNDAEFYLDRRFDSGTPWVILVRMSDMKVISASNLEFGSNDEGVAGLLELIESF
jgi:hypothetical protein